MAAQKKILFICTQSPFSKDNGGQQRTNLIYQYLCSLGHVHLVCITWDERPVDVDSAQCTIHFWGIQEIPYSNPLTAILTIFRFLHPNLEPNKHGFYQSIIPDIIRQVDPDIFVIRYLYPVFSCGIYDRSDLIVDIDDLPKEITRSKIRTEKSIGSKLMTLIRLIHLDYHYKRYVSKWKHAFYCQQGILAGSNTSYLPNIPFNFPAEIKKSSQEIAPPIIAFIGTLFYLPNYEGMNHFLKHIWPRVLQTIPNAQLKIIGQGPPSISLWEQIKNVQVLGFVDDISMIYNSTHLMIAPIYSGSGTNIKVLEAMAWAKPCIISTCASRGLEEHLHDSINIFIAKDDPSFAEKIIEAAKDLQLSLRMGQSARLTIQKYYSREKFRESLSMVIG
jgi:glycosyltransferase involved in cell wall biosynthesis